MSESTIVLDNVLSSSLLPSPPTNGAHRAVIKHVSLPKQRWGRRTVIRLIFELEDGRSATKWLNFYCQNGALHRVCALLIGNPYANFRALKGRECLVKIEARPGRKHAELLIPVAIARPDGSLWVPLGYGGDWEPPRELRERKRKRRTLIQKASDMADKLIEQR